MTPLQAGQVLGRTGYDRPKDWKPPTLEQRMECHAVLLREGQPIDKTRDMADAIADICEVVRLKLMRA